MLWQLYRWSANKGRRCRPPKTIQMFSLFSRSEAGGSRTLTLMHSIWNNFSNSYVTSKNSRRQTISSKQIQAHNLIRYRKFLVQWSCVAGDAKRFPCRYLIASYFHSKSLKERINIFSSALQTWKRCWRCMSTRINFNVQYKAARNQSSIIVRIFFERMRSDGKHL